MISFRMQRMYELLCAFKPCLMASQLDRCGDSLGSSLQAWVNYASNCGNGDPELLSGTPQGVCRT